MRYRNQARRIRRLGALLVSASLTALCLSSCDDFFNSLFDTAAPGGVSASDGKYADRIEVSWSAPDLSGKKWKDSRVTGYLVSWTADGIDPGSESVSWTGHTIHVESGDRAKLYDIEVTTEIDNHYEGSASDTGFALETEDLLWYDGGRGYGFAAADRWYVTMLQKGFDYEFVFAGEETGTVEFIKYRTLEPVLATVPFDAASGHTATWTCDESGDWSKFYVHVVPDSPGATFRAGYGF